MTSNIPPNISINSVLDYGKVERTLISDLEKIRDFSKFLKLNKSVVLIKDVLERVEQRSFSIAVVGEFKRGKSTFINALIGQQILPADILPCSATLNRVTYGIKPEVKIIFKNGNEEKIPIEKLVDYVTKLTPESEITAESIKEAIIYYPIPYCQNNIEVIDTPGLNDDQNMTEVTLSVLPQVDVAIMIILAQSPFSQFERDLLENKLLTHDLGRIIFVVNFWDSYTIEQKERVLQSVKARIQKYVIERAENQFGKDSEELTTYKQKIGEPKVFGIYIKQALEAKQKDDHNLLFQSGFKQFEVALEKFLTQERGVILLEVPANRVISSAKEILTTISIQENALVMKQEEFQAAYDRSELEIATIRERQITELKLIDDAAKKVKFLVRPLIDNFSTELKQASEEAIKATPIEPKEVKSNKNAISALSNKLNKNIENAVRHRTEQISQKIQDEIQKEIDKEVERLQDFAQSVGQALTNIEIQFTEVEASYNRKISSATEAITVALSVFTGFGGIWSGYRVAGLKGAAVGAGASFGTFVAAGFIAGALAIPLALPAVIAIGIASIFTGRTLVNKVFPNDVVENYRKDYTEKTLEALDKQIRELHLEQKIYDEITNAFDVLKQRLRQEVDALLDNTQKTLTELKAKRGRQEAMTEAESQQFKQMRAETERILGNAQRISKQLKEIASV